MATTTSSSPSSSINYFQDMLSKPVLAGVYCALLDRFVMGNEDMNANVVFGGVSAVGSSIGNLISEYVGPQVGPMFLNSTSMYNGTTVAERVIQIATASGTAYALNRYVLKNDLNQDELWMKKIAIIAGGQFLAEYTMDYFNGQPLGYLM